MEIKRIIYNDLSNVTRIPSGFESYLSFYIGINQGFHLDEIGHIWNEESVRMPKPTDKRTIVIYEPN